MRKKLISAVLLFSMIIGLLPLSGCGKTGDTDAYVTRGQWISMLAEAFGMDSYQSQLPYYLDIERGNELFDYVQSSAEWGVLAIYTSENLESEKQVTQEEVGSTAAIAAGCTVDAGQTSTDKGFNSGYSIDYAIAHGIIQSGANLDKKMTVEECESAIDAARITYLEPPEEEKIVVVPVDGIEDWSGSFSDDIRIDGDRVTVPGRLSGDATQSDNGQLTATVDTIDGPCEVEVGEVFLTAPTAEHPAGVAHKISAIEEVDGEIVFTTEAPTLADLYEELDVHTTVSADAANIIWAPGVSASQSSASTLSADDIYGTYTVSFLGYHSRDQRDVRLEQLRSTSMSQSFEFKSGNYEKTWSNKNSSVIGGGPGAQALENSNFVYDGTPSIEDFNGSTDSWTRDLSVENKFSSGYKITGSISINALTVSTDVEYKRSWLFNMPYGIENASVTISSDISSTLTFEGNIGNELKIATIPIPIAATGLTVSVDLYLYVNASGSLEVRAMLGSVAKAEYANSKIKCSAKSNASAEVEAAVEIDFGAELSASLDALGIVKIMDASAKVGGNLSANAYIGGSCEVEEEDGVTTMHYQESMNIQADLYVPIIKISCGGSNTLIGSLGLSKTWTILNKGNGAAAFKLVDYAWVFWEETVTTDGDGNTDSTSNSAGEEEEIGASDETRLDLKAYTLTINGESKRLELDLPVGASMPDVLWSSDNPNIATVDSTGLVSPVSTGTTVITVTLRDDPSVYVRCAVYVQEIGEENWEFLPTSMIYPL